MRMSSAALVLMLIPCAVSPAQATEGAPSQKLSVKLKKGWVGLPFDPPVAKQIKPIVPPKKRSLEAAQAITQEKKEVTLSVRAGSRPGALKATSIPSRRRTSTRSCGTSRPRHGRELKTKNVPAQHAAHAAVRDDDGVARDRLEPRHGARHQVLVALAARRAPAEGIARAGLHSLGVETGQVGGERALPVAVVGFLEAVVDLEVVGRQPQRGAHDSHGLAGARERACDEIGARDAAAGRRAASRRCAWPGRGRVSFMGMSAWP